MGVWVWVGVPWRRVAALRQRWYLYPLSSEHVRGWGGFLAKSKLVVSIATVFLD